jgi:membrane fusion protein (multidrug efflux system)
MADEAPGPDATTARATDGEPGGQAETPHPEKEKKKWRARLLVVVGLVLVALLGGGYWYVKLRGVISTDDAYVDGDRAAVATKMLGRIAELCADEGDTVQAAQLLVQLDDSDLEAQLAQATAELDLAQKSVALAAVNERRAQDDYDRAAFQLDQKAITQEDFDHARTALEASRAEHAIALAKVETARTAVDIVRQRLADTRITAPFRGVVAKRWLLPGEVAQPGQPILTMYDLDDVWITAVFEETKIRYLPVGTAVDVSVDAYPGHAFSGTVMLVGAAAASQFSLIPPANASGNFTKVTQRVPLRIALDRQPPDAADSLRLLPGMSAVVTRSRRE